MIFDTYRFVKRLTAVGMAPRLAEALAVEAARVCPCDFLTKQDLEQFRTRMIARMRQTTHEVIKWTLVTELLTGILVVAAIKL